MRAFRIATLFAIAGCSTDVDSLDEPFDVLLAGDTVYSDHDAEGTVADVGIVGDSIFRWPDGPMPKI